MQTQKNYLNYILPISQMTIFLASKNNIWN